MLLNKQDILMSKLNSQKIRVMESIYKLKQDEAQLKTKSYCKGLCKISHYKFRWIKSKADVYFETFSKLESFDNQIFSCLKCYRRFFRRGQFELTSSKMSSDKRKFHM